MADLQNNLNPPRNYALTLIRVVPVKQGIELRGSSFITKLFCAFSNWIGHLLSDFCGSHSSKGRGMGIPIPFFEVFQFCDVGSIKISGKETVSIAELSIKVFENGYDARFGAAMAIPVILNDLMICLIWSLKHLLYHKEPWDNCIPTNKHSDLRAMLIVGNATLCFVDGVDSAIRSKGNILEFILRINMIGWFKLIIRIFKELSIRYDFTYADLEVQFKYLNQQLSLYVDKLKSVDYEKYEMQMRELGTIEEYLEKEDVDSAMNEMSIYIEKNNIETNFDDYDIFSDFMDDENMILKF